MSYKSGKQKSVMQHDFGKVARADIPRAQFDRSYGIKTTFDAGLLVPFLVDEIVPGDTVNCRATLFARLATPLHPLMDNMRLETFFFFVPNRLVWSNWTKFCGEQDDPGDSIDFQIPALGTTGTITTGDLADYMGLPLSLDVANSTDINALPFRAYRLIWNQFFRDENLQNSLLTPSNDGPDTNGELGWADPPLRRGKRYDYFTSCLPWPQKGATAVTIPIGELAPLTTDGNTSGDVEVQKIQGGGTGTQRFGAASTFVNITGGQATETTNLFADLSNATAATINQLRQAFAVQKLLERDARGGTRYIEVIKSHFGVSSSDARLQRPEYLGGGSTPIGIQPVANTTGVAAASSPSGEDEFQGNLSGVGTGLVQGDGFVKSFEEHGFVIGLVNARADLTYQQGIDRFWRRNTRYDYLWPVFSHIGEQAVLNSEIWSDGTSADDDIFGYNGRYDEYRFKQSQITGLFRSDAASSLDAWHLSEDFASLPTLGDTFIQDDPPIDRVVAVPAEPHFLMDGYVNYKHTRPLPLFGTPGMIDHF